MPIDLTHVHLQLPAGGGSGIVRVPPVPLRLPPPDLETWLAARPRTRQALVWMRPPPPMTWKDVPVAYAQWTAEEKQRLATAFAQAWHGSLHAEGTLPVNLTPSPLNDMPRTTVSFEEAATQYFETAGACLAYDARLPSDSPHRLELQDGPTRSHSLDARSLFDYYNGYRFLDRYVPARPGYVLKWLAGLGLPKGATLRQTAAAVVGYCGRFFHMAGWPNGANYLAHWHYDGGCPMVRVIEKTVLSPIPDYPNPPTEPRHYTPGCFGTAWFIEHALRPINLRVRQVYINGHVLVHLPQLGVYLSHCDDPYGLKFHPEVDPDALFIDEAQFAAWFGPDVPESERAANVGRRAKELFG